MRSLKQMRKDRAKLLLSEMNKCRMVKLDILDHERDIVIQMERCNFFDILLGKFNFLRKRFHQYQKVLDNECSRFDKLHQQINDSKRYYELKDKYDNVFFDDYLRRLENGGKS